MSEQDRAFEKLFGYAVYNGLVIDRAWEECELWGEGYDYRMGFGAGACSTHPRGTLESPDHRRPCA
jgi:hypothetical protein